MRLFLRISILCFTLVIANVSLAHAGNYLVRECSTENPAHSDWTVQKSTEFDSADNCATGYGLQNSGPSTGGLNSIPFIHGSNWISRAPTGTRINGLNVEMAMETDDYGYFGLDDNLQASMQLGDESNFTIQTSHTWDGPLNTTGSIVDYETASITNNSATPSYTALLSLACGSTFASCSGYPVNFLGTGIGPWAAWRNLVTTINDYTSPTSTFGGAVTNGGWKSAAKYPSGETVSVSSNDVGGGVKFTVFQLDGSPSNANTRCVVTAGGFYTSYNPCPASTADTPTFTYGSLSDGDHSLKYQTYDVGDNLTESTTATIHVDNTAPAAPSGPTAAVGRTLTFTGVTDATSGIDTANTYPEIFYNGVWTQVTGSSLNSGTVTATIPSTFADGSAQVRLRAVDNAGNTRLSTAANYTIGNIPSNSVAPTATLPTSGPATSTNGTWTNSPTSYTYQWQRCVTTPGSCVDINGATGQTYTPVAADDGHQLRICVTATNAVGSTTVCSDLTDTVHIGPANTTKPTVALPSNGPATGTKGSWNNDPTGYTYQWQRCVTTPDSCDNIEGATGQTYAPVAADDGHQLRLCVTATNAAGSTTVCSDLTDTVHIGPTNTTAPKVVVDAGNGKGTGTPGTWSGNPTGFTYQWQRCPDAASSCVNISGATTSQYTIVAADADMQLRLCVTATNAAGSTTVCSPLSSKLASGCRTFKATRHQAKGIRIRGHRYVSSMTSPRKIGARNFIRFRVFKDPKHQVKKVTVTLNGKKLKKTSKTQYLKPTQFSTKTTQKVKITFTLKNKKKGSATFTLKLGSCK